MPSPGPGPVAAAHRILIVTALVATLCYAAWEASGFFQTGDRWAAARAALAIVVAAGLARYLRSLRGLAAKLTPRPPAAVLLAVALALPASAHAGAITLETTLRTTVAEDVKATVLVRNTGTDTAHDVRPRVRFEDAERLGELVRELPPRSSHEWTVDFPRPATRGRYPLLVTVSYNDPGFRGFSAVSATLVDVDGVFPGRFHGSVSKLSVDAEGTLTIVLVNDDTVAHEAHLSVFLPDELGGVRDVGVQQQPPGQARTITVPIRNHGALAGSRYPVYAVVRVDAEPHSAALLVGTVDVITSTAIDWQAYLPRSALVLAIAFLVTEITLALLAWWRPDPGATPPPRT
jgi:hypothetical protein